MLITKARAENYKVLAKLLFMSGPVNLISLLTGHLVTLDQHQKQKICLEFLETALQHPNGQFGFNNQTVVCKNDILCACVSYCRHQ